MTGKVFTMIRMRVLNDGVKKPQTSSIYTLLIKCCDNKPWCVVSTKELLLLSGYSLPTFRKYLQILVEDGLVVVRPVKGSPKGDDTNEYFLPSMEKAFYAKRPTPRRLTNSPQVNGRSQRIRSPPPDGPEDGGFAIDTIAVRSSMTGTSRCSFDSTAWTEGLNWPKWSPKKNHKSSARTKKWSRCLLIIVAVTYRSVRGPARPLRSHKQRKKPCPRRFATERSRISESRRNMNVTHGRVVATIAVFPVP